MALWSDFPTADSTQEGRTLSVTGGLYSLATDSGQLPLKRFRQALAVVDTVALNWWAFGDSITESGLASKFDNGYVLQLLRTLQKRATTTGRGGAGFLSTYLTFFSGSSGSNNYWVFSGGGVTVSSGNVFGAKRYAFTTGETATLTFTGTSFQLHHRQGDVTSIPFTVTIDGGSPVTVTPSTTGGGSVRGVYTSGLLARGVHTVVVAPANPANTMIVYAAMIYDGDEIGIRCYNHGVGGANTTTFLASNASSFADQNVVAANPALVTIMLGTNDYINGVTPSVTQSNLSQVIANVKSAVTLTPSFLLIVPMQPFRASPAFPWSQYQAAIKAAAAADPTNVAVLDLTDHFVDVPTAGNSYTRGLMNSDAIHPVDAGHLFAAQVIAARLCGTHNLAERGEPSVADLSAKADDTATVHVTGNETIAGTKTFSSSPTVPDVPASGASATNKNYVLSVASSGGIPIATITAKGDLIAGTASATVARVGVSGTNGNVLTEDSTQAGGFHWSPPTGGGGLGLTPTATKTANYTAAAGDEVICDATGGTFTVTLPAAAAGVIVGVRKGDSSANVVTFAAAGADTIGQVSPVTSATLSIQGQTIILVGIAGGWIPVSSTPLTALDSRYTKTPNIQYFTASGTWTKPTGAVRVRAVVASGGEGGGSGRCSATGVVASGGGGGGGGSVAEAEFRASDLTATVTVTVGTGGPGGAAQTVASTNGNAGGTPTASSFGTYLLSQSGAGGGTAGAGGTTAGAAGGVGMLGIGSLGGIAGSAAGGAAGSGQYSAGGGGGGRSDGGVGTTGGGAFGLGGAAGAGGGGITAANAASNGGVGGSVFLSTVVAAGTAGVVGGASPGNGGDALAGATGGAGGGGGAGGLAVNGQAGANGGLGGGGGGGGGGSRDGFNSGAGGAGGAGCVYVISE